MSSEMMAVAEVAMSILPMLRRYIPHLGRNSLGMSRNPRPRKSLIWVEKIVNAMPAVNPTTIG